MKRRCRKQNESYRQGKKETKQTRKQKIKQEAGQPTSNDKTDGKVVDNSGLGKTKQLTKKKAK